MFLNENKRTMKYPIILILLLASMFSNAQNVEILDYNQLEPRLSTTSDTTYVVNFWATWCKPCVEELPDFFKVENEMKNEKFKLLLVSLDFSTHIDSRVKPFIKKHNISTEIVVLDDPDANTWINKVEPTWDGSIPVTIVFNSTNRLFIDKTINHEDLKTIVENMLR